MIRGPLVSFFCLLVLTFTGCTMTAVSTVAGDDWTRMSLNGIDYEIPGAIVRSDARGDDLHCLTESTEIEVHRHYLKVNGTSYGKLDLGDHVHVEENGTVRVNGQTRTPLQTI